MLVARMLLGHDLPCPVLSPAFPCFGVFFCVFDARCMTLQAVVDPSAAWANIVALHGTAAAGAMTGAAVDEGDSLTSMLYWVATRGAR